MSRNATESGYAPELTTSENLIIEALVNPENRMKSVAELCKLLKIDRSTYYRAFQKPEFVEIYKQRSAEIIKQSIAPVINAFVREAQRGSYQHGKALLEMAGIYTEEQQARIAALKAKAQINETGVTEDDGFIDALAGKVDEVWQDE